MQQQMRRRGFTIGLISLGLLVGSVVMAGPVQAQTPTSAGPYYATPSWDQTLTATRFIILSNFASAAVLDRNTGLVWEQAPDITGGPISDGSRSWTDATRYCVNKNVGGTRGWRLPAVVELASLLDPNNSNPMLPTGHPFSNVQSAYYWSASALADDSARAWLVLFSNGFVGAVGSKANGNHAWCVRGPMNADAY